MKERKRKITIITVIGIMLMLAITTFTYAIWSRTHTQTGINKNTYACFEISYAETNGEGITMDNGFPQTDEQGMQNDAYEVEITNTCDTVSTYNVILNKQQGSDLKDEHLKVAVDNDYKLLSDATPTDTRTITDFQNEKSYIIGTGVVGPKQTKVVKIRSWMDKDTSEQEGENKSFTFKITIEAEAGDNNYEVVKVLGKDYVARTETPDFTAGFPNNTTPEGEETSKSGLYKTQDDDGDTYYFRGKVENNYVKFGQGVTEANDQLHDLMWRIVRINGDGTIRLMLDESIGYIVYNEVYDDYKYSGFTYDNAPCKKTDPCVTNYSGSNFTNTHGGTNSIIKSSLENWYKENLTKYDSQIALSTFCNDVSYGDTTIQGIYEILVFGSKYRVGTLKHPDLHCQEPKEQNNSTYRTYGGVYKLKIGLITADELVMGGYSWDAPYATTDNYLRYNSIYWTMSPDSADISGETVLAANSNGKIKEEGINIDDNTHPVINLNSDVTVTGSGTQEDPYVVQ